MHAWIRQIAIMMFAALMLFSTTGVTIYHHICGCPVPMPQTVQISDPGHSCCHVPDAQPEPVRCSDENHDACDAENHDGCKDEVTYLKVPILSTMPVQELAVSVPSFEMPLLRRFTSRSDDDAGFSDESRYSKPLIRSYLLPPRAGGSLIILLHSIKIPFPEDHC